MHRVRDVGTFGDERVHGGDVGDVDTLEYETHLAFEKADARLLQGDVVIGIQIVEADHGFAAVEQRAGDMEADESGGPGHEDGHQKWVPTVSLRPV